MEAPPKPPASLRVATAFKHLAKSSQALNESVTEWAGYIHSLNSALKKLNIGVSAWYNFAEGQDDDGHGFWSRQIGYSKIGDDHCLVIRKVWGDLRSPDEESSETWRFEEAPRWLMLDATGKIADLLETLVKRTDETTARVAKRKKETAELAEVLNSLASDVSLPAQEGK
jgi:hypothetical protein